MRKATWKILDRGKVPERCNHIEFMCTSCWHEAQLPILGLPMAQIEMGIVFDIFKHAMPRLIQCRKCRRRYQLEENNVRQNL